MSKRLPKPTAEDSNLKAINALIAFDKQLLEISTSAFNGTTDAFAAVARISKAWVEAGR